MREPSHGAASDDEEGAGTHPYATIWNLLTVRAPDLPLFYKMVPTKEFEKEQEEFKAKQKKLEADRKNFDDEVRAETMGFTVTVKDLSAAQPWTMQEAADMVGNYAYVKQGDVYGKDGRLLTRLNKGMARKHGWLVYARALNDVAPAKGDLYGVPKDAMIGVLLITSMPKDWEGIKPIGINTVRTRMADVNAVATHHLKRNKGVAKEMWKAFESAIMQDDKLNAPQPDGKAAMPFKINVNEKNCLNNDAARGFYIKCGFTIPAPEGTKTPEELNGHIMYDEGKFVPLLP